MDQDKFGKLIKDIRKKYNLTQNDLAKKYNVTYQAVSKWENGKNMPDISLIKQIASDFNISMDEMFEIELNDKSKSKLNIIYILLFIILLVISVFLLNHDDSFKFKTITSSCDNFKISGNIAYNNNKSAIYISNIEYCGGNDEEEYENIECTLYETSGDIEKKISSCDSSNKGKIKLEDYLEDVVLSSDNYERTCKEYTENSLYLEINATDDNKKITTYKIPIKLNESCDK